jgi:hypothetical protein
MCVPGQAAALAGIIVADDLAFWAVALRFIGALVARHAYLPDLVKAASGFPLAPCAERTRSRGDGAVGGSNAGSLPHCPFEPRRHGSRCPGRRRAG